MKIVAILWDIKGGNHVIVTASGREIRLTGEKLKDMSLGALRRK